MTRTTTALPVLLTYYEVAEALGCSHGTVKNLVRAGDLESVKVGRLCRVTPEALAAYIKAASRPVTSARGRMARVGR